MEKGHILAHPALMRVIEEVAAAMYKATALSAALTVPKYRDIIVFWYVADYIDSCVDTHTHSLSLCVADNSHPARKQHCPSSRNG